MTTDAIVRSSLWAAYGDALGFITEFRDASAIQRAYATEGVTEPIPWKRRIGGRFGPTVLLPRGCYSDDTQLRIATGRAIRGDGYFDVEAFARVELPVWLSYHLGAGRATKAAAHNLERKDVNWFSNFYTGKDTHYRESGGNGAAMRVQPHVWASATRDEYDTRMLLDVLRNAITTHGHPRGFLGAMFHAQCLAFVLRHNRQADPSDWHRFTHAFQMVLDLVSSDETLDQLWRPSWEAQSGQRLADAVRVSIQEHVDDIDQVTRQLMTLNVREAYRQIIRVIGGTNRPTAGSGTKTALAAAALSFLFSSRSVDEALAVASNEFGSDTDTIATMAGALLGATATEEPPVLPQDAGYLRKEAGRLAAIAQGEAARSFSYPDLLHWRAPKTQLDTVGVFNGGMAVAGLGPASPSGNVSPSPTHSEVGWEWLRLRHGQTILAKRRAKLAKLSVSSMPHQLSRGHAPARADSSSMMHLSSSAPTQGYQASLFEAAESSGNEPSREIRSLDQASSLIVSNGFDERMLGRFLLDVIDSSSAPIEDAIALVAILAKARIARKRRASKGYVSESHER